jgi:hypothetical protein
MDASKVLAGIFISVAVLLGCKKSSPTEQAKTIDDLLVKNNEIAGWSYSGAGWTANTIADLTNYIDGAAPVYQRHGFIEAAHQRYQGSVNDAAAVINVTVYNQGTAANATDLYNDSDLGFSGAIDWNTAAAGNAAHYVRNGGLSQELAFARNGYYVSIDINADTDESLNTIQQFALNIDGKIK